ncbi:TolC family protein [uncultured Bacteroides sp.]|uniref:TolC family protein n=1 Tax=uncultured Bacteroides sp. TaxID=162156 RepID=UPI002AA6C326|nr:TolC family protein [uncultured Bacteroides sp.]
MRTLQLFLLLILSATVQAQNVLTLDKAVNIALKNNFDILVSRNDADMDQINNTPGNAGMLPTINLNGSGGYEYNNVYQKNSSGITKYPNQSSTSLNANVELSWTLFDGGKMFVTKNKLNQIQALGELQFQTKVQETMYNVIAAYYDVVRQKQQLSSINEAISYNKERVTIAQTGFNAGTLAKTDLLQAKIDLNVEMESAIDQQNTISESLKTLNSILGEEDPTIKFDISDSIPLQYSPDRDELLRKLNSSNTSILSFQKQIEISQLALKESQKDKLPTLQLNGGYYLSQAINSEGSTLKNRTYGPQIGMTLSIPLYNGGETKRKISIARKEVQSSGYDMENVKLQVNIELENTLTDFDNQRQLFLIEKSNNELAKENLDICLQRLRLGQTTSLEVHQAQESYVQSATRLTNFEYNLKIAETKLKQLTTSL